MAVCPLIYPGARSVADSAIPVLIVLAAGPVILFSFIDGAPPGSKRQWDGINDTADPESGVPAWWGLACLSSCPGAQVTH